MDSSDISQIIFLILLISGSAFFSATETAFSSLNRLKLQTLADGGNLRAKKTLKLCEQYDKLLSSILVGNTIVNITSTSIATVLFVRYCGESGVALSTIIMTIIVLLFGEFTPNVIAT